MNKKPIFLVGAGLALAATAYLLSPLFYDRVVAEPPPALVREASVPMASSSTPVTTATSTSTPMTPPLATRGSFVGVLGHQATGTVLRVRTATEDLVYLEEDFVATNGPDLFLYLGKDGEIDKSKRLGALKGNKGSQAYQIPLDWAVEGHDEVWIWCRAFSVPFAWAELRPVVR